MTTAPALEGVEAVCGNNNGWQRDSIAADVPVQSVLDDHYYRHDDVGRPCLDAIWRATLTSHAARLDDLDMTEARRRYRVGIARDGKLAIPVYDPWACEPEIVDLITFRPETPLSWHSTTGQGVVLGLDLGSRFGPPVAVFRDPVAWLRAGGDGTVILCWKRARDLLVGTPRREIIVQDKAHGREIEDALHRTEAFPFMWAEAPA